MRYHCLGRRMDWSAQGGVFTEPRESCWAPRRMVQGRADCHPENNEYRERRRGKWGVSILHGKLKLEAQQKQQKMEQPFPKGNLIENINTEQNGVRKSIDKKSSHIRRSSVMNFSSPRLHPEPILSKVPSMVPPWFLSHNRLFPHLRLQAREAPSQ